MCTFVVMIKRRAFWFHIIPLLVALPQLLFPHFSMMFPPIHSSFSSFRYYLGLHTYASGLTYRKSEYQIPASFLLESAFAPLKTNGKPELSNFRELITLPAVALYR